MLRFALLAGVACALAACDRRGPDASTGPRAAESAARPSGTKDFFSAPAPPPPTTPLPPAPTEAITAPPGALLAGENTVAVIVGVLSFGEPGIAGWSAEKRKDLELYQVLRARGVPARNMTLLLDGAATAAEVKRALEHRARSAPPGSTLLFYYAGHGARDGQGSTHFLAYDTKSGAPDSGVVLSQVAATLKREFKGQRVLLMADCCYSGALKDVADAVSASGRVEAASLTSADASNLSTENWTFTQTVIDGLRGDGLMDENRDGTLALNELSHAVQREMQYREKQRHGFHLSGVPAGATLSRAPGVALGSGPFPAGSYVLAPDERGMPRTALVRRAGKSESNVRFYHYNQAEDRTVPSASLSKLGFRRYPKGAKLRVFWGGKLWDATVTATDGDFHFITYPGWPAYWDEWVMSDRIADASAVEAATRERVQIEWRGMWWPGVILKRRGARFLVRYEGYGKEWDEWVTEARLKRGR